MKTTRRLKCFLGLFMLLAVLATMTGCDVNLAAIFFPDAILINRGSGTLSNTPRDANIYTARGGSANTYAIC